MISVLRLKKSWIETTTVSRLDRILFAFGGITLFFSVVDQVQPAEYQSCFRWQIQTTDSNIGLPVGPDAGQTEDRYATVGGNSCNLGCNVIARGVRVKISRGNWSRTYDSHPVTGCVEGFFDQQENRVQPVGDNPLPQ